MASDTTAAFTGAVITIGFSGLVTTTGLLNLTWRRLRFHLAGVGIVFPFCKSFQNLEPFEGLSPRFHFSQLGYVW